jgi:hypothetical protein
MNRNTPAQTTTTRLINALLRVLAPGEEVCVESEMLKHFPFARIGEQTSPQARLRMQTTVHGSL